MLRNDLVNHPPPNGVVSKASLSKAKSDLQTYPFDTITEEEMQMVGIKYILMYTSTVRVSVRWVGVVG